MSVTLLALRFFVEIALFASIFFVGTQLSATALVTWTLAVLLTGLAIVVWGVLLSPRRRVDLPLWVRVAIELLLFALATWGLVWSGHAAWGVALVVAEVVALIGLWSIGLPPGSDAAAHEGDRRPA